MAIENKINTASVSLKSLDPLNHSLELLHFGFRGLTVEAERFLEARGLSRVHHRILYVIARSDAISIGELATTLGVSNQALHRPLSHLFEQALVQYTREPGRHRFKLLALSEAGTALEKSSLRAMPRSNRSRCSARLTLGMIMCRSCRRPGSALASERERKSACFWLLPSSTTRSPGAINASRAATILSLGMNYAIGEVAHLIESPGFFSATTRPLRRWVYCCCH